MSTKKIDLGKPVLMCDFNTPGSSNFNREIRSLIAKLDAGMTIAAFCRKSKKSILKNPGIGEKHMLAIDSFLAKYGLKLGMSQKALEDYEREPEKVDNPSPEQGADKAEKAYVDWPKSSLAQFLNQSCCLKFEARPDNTYTVMYLIPMPIGEAGDTEFRAFLEVHNDKGDCLERLLPETVLYDFIRNLEALLDVKKKADRDNTPAALRTLEGFHPDLLLTVGGKDFLITTQWAKDARAISGRPGGRFVMRFSLEGSETKFAVSFTEMELDYAAGLFTGMLYNISTLNGHLWKWGKTFTAIRDRARSDARAWNIFGTFTRLNEDLDKLSKSKKS